MSALIPKIPPCNRPCRKMFEFMDAPPRGALILVRFVAAGLIGLGCLDSGLYIVDCLVRHQTILPWRAMLELVPFFVGIPLLIKSRVVADWISEILD